MFLLMQMLVGMQKQNKAAVNLDVGGVLDILTRPSDLPLRKITYHHK